MAALPSVLFFSNRLFSPTQPTRDRFRTIFITTTTTIAGLLPLLAETSVQAAAIKPLVISVVFGLLTTTVLVLVMIPALYVLFDEWGLDRTGV